MLADVGIYWYDSQPTWHFSKYLMLIKIQLKKVIFLLEVANSATLNQTVLQKLNLIQLLYSFANVESCCQ